MTLFYLIMVNLFILIQKLNSEIFFSFFQISNLSRYLLLFLMIFPYHRRLLSYFFAKICFLMRKLALLVQLYQILNNKVFYLIECEIPLFQYLCVKILVSLSVRYIYLNLLLFRVDNVLLNSLLFLLLFLLVLLLFLLVIF